MLPKNVFRRSSNVGLKNELKKVELTYGSTIMTQMWYIKLDQNLSKNWKGTHKTSNHPLNKVTLKLRKT